MIAKGVVMRPQGLRPSARVPTCPPATLLRRLLKVEEHHQSISSLLMLCCI